MADVEEGTIYRVKAELEDDYTSVSKCPLFDYILGKVLLNENLPRSKKIEIIFSPSPTSPNADGNLLGWRIHLGGLLRSGRLERGCSQVKHSRCHKHHCWG